MNPQSPTLPRPGRRAALAVLLALAALPGAAADLDRTSAELAASLVLRDLRAELRDKPADPATLRDAMLADPAPNADPADAERNMALAHSNALARAFADEARALLDRLAAPAPRSTRFSEPFLADAETAPPEDLAAATAAAFPAAFRQARDEAVRAQAARLEASVRPDPAEVEAMPHDALVRELSARIERAQAFAVFHENRATIERELAGPILDDAYAQREAQREEIRRAGPSAPGFAPSVVAANLAATLRERLDERRAADPATFVYGPFPSATGEVARAAAEARAAARFAEAAAETPVPLDEAAMRAAIAADPAAHRRREDSLAVFGPALRDALRAAAGSALLARAPESERAECAEFLRAHADDPALADAVAARVRGALEPRLGAVRGAVADEQFREALPDLAAGSWTPSEAVVDAVCAAENDFRRTLGAWRRAPGLESFAAAAPEERLLAEAAERIDRAVLAVFEAGAAARGAQHKIVDSRYEETKAAVAALAETPDVDRIAALYATRVALEWAEARPGAIGLAADAPDDGRYLDLFPSTIEKIRLLAKTMLEALERERAETPPVPEQPPTPDAPPEPPREIPVECDLVFDRRGDDFEVAVKAEGRELGRFRCPADPRRFERRVEAFSGEAAEALAALLRERTRKGPVALRVNLVVRNGLIYWAAVTGVSGSVRTVVEGFGEAVTAEFTDAAGAR